MIIINDGIPDKIQEQKEVERLALKSLILDFRGKITESSFFNDSLGKKQIKL